jgi:hypothetical protein
LSLQVRDLGGDVALCVVSMISFSFLTLTNREEFTETYCLKFLGMGAPQYLGIIVFMANPLPHCHRSFDKDYLNQPQQSLYLKEK